MEKKSEQHTWEKGHFVKKKKKKDKDKDKDKAMKTQPSSHGIHPHSRTSSPLPHRFIKQKMVGGTT